MLGHQNRLIFTSNLLVFIKVDTENMSRQYSGRWAVITNRSAGRLLLFQEAVIYLIYKYPFKRQNIPTLRDTLRETPSSIRRKLFIYVLTLASSYLRVRQTQKGNANPFFNTKVTSTFSIIRDYLKEIEIVAYQGANQYNNKVNYQEKIKSPRLTNHAQPTNLEHFLNFKHQIVFLCKSKLRIGDKWFGRERLMHDNQAYQYIAHSFTKNTLRVHQNILPKICTLKKKNKSGIRPNPRNMVSCVYVLFYIRYLVLHKMRYTLLHSIKRS